MRMNSVSTCFSSAPVSMCFSSAPVNAPLRPPLAGASNDTSPGSQLYDSTEPACAAADGDSEVLALAEPAGERLPRAPEGDAAPLGDAPKDDATAEGDWETTDDADADAAALTVAGDAVAHGDTPALRDGGGVPRIVT